MPSNPTPVVFVTGPPAAGKTTLARNLADDLRVPLIAKDGIKERLYDTLGAGDREWSRRLGAATYAVLFQMLDDQLRAGRSCVVEGTFGPTEANRELASINARWPFTALQLYCTAPVPLLAERYEARASRRHPGHVDGAITHEIRTRLEAGDWQPLTLPGTVVTVDTATFEAVNLSDIAARVADHLAGTTATLPSDASRRLDRHPRR